MTFRYELDSEKPGWSVDDDCVDIKNPDLCFIFLHGYTSGPEYWDPRIKAIKNDMRIIKSHKKIKKHSCSNLKTKIWLMLLI